MKKITIAILFTFLSSGIIAQTDSTATDSTKANISNQLYKIELAEGRVIVGKIIKEDKREVQVVTSKGKEMIIPLYVIESITPIDDDHLKRNGEYKQENTFSSRYSLTASALPIKKGEGYAQFSWFGAELQYGLGGNFGIGIMTSWLGTPMIANFKKSWKLHKNVHLAVGALAGTHTWSWTDFTMGVPFGSLTLGNEYYNITLTGGYGAVRYGDETTGRSLASIAGTARLTDKISFVFDSFIVLPKSRTVTKTTGEPPYSVTQQVIEKYPSLMLLIPALRWQKDAESAFQFGFTGAAFDNEFAKAPIPMIQWFRKL